MPLFDLFFALLWFFVFIAWIWTVVSVIGDVFRSDDLGGGGKAMWVLFIIIIPLIGVVTYLIARGQGMAERRLGDVMAREEAFRSYVQDAAGGGGSAADELKKLADLRAAGVLTEDEFAAQKSKILG
jgi:predicted membrane channel-forming protein YqfA (hemolysin III family)